MAKPELLGETLREEGYMLRRTKDAVLDQLPPKRRLVQRDRRGRRSLPRADDPRHARPCASLRDARTNFDRARIEDEICQRMRRATGMAKAPYVAAFVRALLEGGEKVLLFAHHHGVMDAYRTALASAHPVFVTGRETAAQKDRAVDAFMTGKTDLCCISMRAAAGLNLQRATCVVFGELDWSPAVHTQAEDRAHRMGQKDSVLCYYLVSPRGSDSADAGGPGAQGQPVRGPHGRRAARPGGRAALRAGRPAAYRAAGGPPHPRGRVSVYLGRMTVTPPSKSCGARHGLARSRLATGRLKRMATASSVSVAASVSVSRQLAGHVVLGDAHALAHTQIFEVHAGVGRVLQRVAAHQPAQLQVGYGLPHSLCTVQLLPSSVQERVVSGAIWPVMQVGWTAWVVPVAWVAPVAWVVPVA